jgi:hypothetical protein
MYELLNIPAYRNMFLSNWDRMAEATGGLGPNYDYSLLNARDISSGHYGDAGKLPWHPTFSNESAYSSPQFMGGRWDGDVFTPSIDQLQGGYAGGLMNYLRNAGVKLGTPPPLSQQALKSYLGE